MKDGGGEGGTPLMPEYATEEIATVPTDVVVEEAGDDRIGVLRRPLVVPPRTSFLRELLDLRKRRSAGRTSEELLRRQQEQLVTAEATRTGTTTVRSPAKSQADEDTQVEDPAHDLDQSDEALFAYWKNVAAAENYVNPELAQAKAIADAEGLGAPGQDDVARLAEPGNVALGNISHDHASAVRTVRSAGPARTPVRAGAGGQDDEHATSRPKATTPRRPPGSISRTGRSGMANEEGELTAAEQEKDYEIHSPAVAQHTATGPELSTAQVLSRRTPQVASARRATPLIRQPQPPVPPTS